MHGPVRGFGCCPVCSARRFLRAEAAHHFELPLPPSRPWWKLWSKEEREPELSAIVGDLRKAA